MTSGPKPGAETTRIHMKYDAWNRMTAVYADDGNGEPGAVIAEYRYDGLTRRIQKIVEGSPDVTYDYYYNESRQCLETRKGGNTNPLEQFVWSPRYVHSPVLRWRDGNCDGDYADEGDSVLYYCNDANFNVTALVGTDGSVVERVVYDPYGKPTFYDGSWANPSATSAYSNDVLFTGHRLDTETGLFYGGFRYYHPTMGRWTIWDPRPYAREMSLVEYCSSLPTSVTDPLGTVWYKPWTWWSKDDEELSPDEKAAKGAAQGAGEAAQEAAKNYSEDGKLKWGKDVSPETVGARLKGLTTAAGMQAVDTMIGGLDAFANSDACTKWYSDAADVIKEAGDSKTTCNPCAKIALGTDTSVPIPAQKNGMGIAGRCQTDLVVKGGNFGGGTVGMAFAAFAKNLYEKCNELFKKTHP